MPQVILDFSNKKLTSYEEGGIQRTESTTVTGSSNYFLTLNLQDGVTLINETRGTQSVGNVNVYGGDTFHLQAPLNINGTWVSSNITNCKYNFQPIIYRVANESLQDLAGKIQVIEDPTTVTNLTVNWLNRGALNIHKIDDETRENIADTTFSLKDNNGTTVSTAKTNSQGIARFEDIILGNYKIVETQANSDYILNSEEKNVSIASGENSIELTNKHKKGNLVVYKVDAENHSIVVKDAVFDVFDENNKLVKTIKTDDKGIARLDNIRTGRYKLIEKSTNEYYKVDTQEKYIDVSKENSNNTITIENTIKKGYIEINKYDKDAFEKHNKKLGVADVTFGIFDDNGNKIEEITTDENGYAKSSKLRIDKKYVVKELKTRDEYIVNESKWNVDLTKNGIVDEFVYTLNVLNEHKKGNLFIEKITKDDKTIQLGNVEFELYLVGNGETNLYIGTYYTDANGEIYIENLNTGNYVLKETSTNRWYYLSDNTSIEVKWSKEFGDTNVTIENEKKKGIIKVIKTDEEFKQYPLENIEFNVYDEDNNYIETIKTNSEGIAESSRLRIDKKYYLVESKTQDNYILDDTIYTIDFTEGLTKDQIEDIQTDTIHTLELTNKHKKGNLVVYKVDADDNTIKIPGVEFELYVKNVDKPYTENQLIGTYTTDNEGKIEINDLWTGEYYLKETNTNIWYKLNTDNKELEIKYNETSEITIENEKIKGQVKVIKIDKDNHEYKIPDVTFEILDSNMNVIETITTDENGEAVSSKLPCIEEVYYLREINTKETYVLSDEVKEITLTADEITNIEFENEKIKGYVEITKTDSKTKENLSGATFGIFDENNNQIGTLTTDSNGKAKSELLPYGKYYLKELDTGSHYYLLNENTYEFEIKVDGEIVKKEIDNEPVNIEVTVEKEGTTEIKPNEKVDYEFSNVGNASNVYLENFKWYDYIPTDYIRLEKMTTGTWNQDLYYDVYYKTNKSEDYILFKESLNTNTNYDLDFTTIELAEDEYITETCFDFGKVDIGFKENIHPTMQCQPLDTLEDGTTFTNHTETVGVYFGVTAKANSKWTTIVHKPEENHEVILPRTGK